MSYFDELFGKSFGKSMMNAVMEGITSECVRSNYPEHGKISVSQTINGEAKNYTKQWRIDKDGKKEERESGDPDILYSCFFSKAIRVAFEVWSYIVLCTVITLSITHIVLIDILVESNRVRHMHVNIVSIVY